MKDEADALRLYWQVQALRGQVEELERERNRTGNTLWLMRQVLTRALRWMGHDDDLTELDDAALLRRFENTLRQDYRFSPCPNAPRLRCRPMAMQFTRDGDLVRCEDCGWDVSAVHEP
ncbi:MAG: hypothetical protein ACLFTK_03865 [Anaerolineales bacterium]